MNQLHENKPVESKVTEWLAQIIICTLSIVNCQLK